MRFEVIETLVPPSVFEFENLFVEPGIAGKASLNCEFLAAPFEPAGFSFLASCELLAMLFGPSGFACKPFLASCELLAVPFEQAGFACESFLASWDCGFLVMPFEPKCIDLNFAVLEMVSLDSKVVDIGAFLLLEEAGETVFELEAGLYCESSRIPLLLSFIVLASPPFSSCFCFKHPFLYKQHTMIGTSR